MLSSQIPRGAIAAIRSGSVAVICRPDRELPLPQRHRRPRSQHHWQQPGLEGRASVTPS